MKKLFLTILSALALVPASAQTATGEGTEAAPYNCAKVIELNPESKDPTDGLKGLWIEGYIVGSYNNKVILGTDGAVATNLLIADNTSATEKADMVCVQLVSKSDPRTALNLVDNPTNVGKKVILQGDICKYNTLPGLKNTSAYKFADGEGGGDTPVDPTPAPLFTETFAANQGAFTIENVELGTLSYVWKWDTYKYMKASAYFNGACNATDSYLVSPVFDATKASEMVLTFDHAVNKFGSDLAKEQATLVAREEGGEWQSVAIPTYGTNKDWNFVASGDIDLSAYAGKKFQVAFHYTSTTESAGTWEVKNFAINGKGTLTIDVPAVETVKVANIAAFKAGKDETATYEFTNPVNVIYQNGQYLYVQDTTGDLLIYGTAGQTYAEGDVIPAGFTGNYAIFHEGVQLTNPAGLAAATGKATVAPAEIALEEVATDLINNYVKFEGVTIAQGTNGLEISQDGTTLAIYDSFKINPATGENLTVIGFVSYYKALQIVPLTITDAGGEVVEKVAEPVFSVKAGAVVAGTEVELTCATEGATIVYTTDGTEPSEAQSVTVYTKPIVINEAMTIKAVAYKEGLENSPVATAAYTIREAGAYKGEFDTFNDSKTSTSYGTYTNATGWTTENCAIIGGSDTEGEAANPNYAFIGPKGTLAPIMNGKTSAPGKIYSPILSDKGIGTLTFNYGLPFSDKAIDFTVNIYGADGTTLVKTDNVKAESATTQTAYDYSLVVNHDKGFKIEIVNNCPSAADKNKDRTAIWNLTWTDFTSGIQNVDTEAENAPVEYFNLQGVRVAAPQGGIFLRRQGSKVEKVVIR